MLQCYGLSDMVATGAEAAPFLVTMARLTAVPKGTKLIPYMVEYYANRETVETVEGE